RERTNVDIQSIGVNYLFLENVRDDRDTRRSIYLYQLNNDSESLFFCPFRAHSSNPTEEERRRGR
ncbi:hypothetical protein FOC1_g10013953, partial [Fusarium oxysporum f. sp. cubense race 1]